MPQRPEVRCALCGGAGRDYRPKQGYVGILICEACGHLFAASQEDSGAGFYDLSYFQENPLAYGDSLAGRPIRWVSEFYGGLLRTMEGMTSGRHLLDVGCGLGGFMLVAAERGWEAEGLDVSEAVCRFARERTKRPIHLGTLEEGTYPANAFDAIAAVHVIEHLPAPRETLKIMKSTLRPGGILLLVTPNLRGVSTYLFGGRNYVLDVNSAGGRGHLQFFSQAALSRLLSMIGFELLHAETRDFLLLNLAPAWERIRGQAIRPVDLGPSRQGRTRSRLRSWIEEGRLPARAIVAVNTLLLRPLGIGDQLVAVARRRD